MDDERNGEWKNNLAIGRGKGKKVRSPNKKKENKDQGEKIKVQRIPIKALISFHVCVTTQVEY